MASNNPYREKIVGHPKIIIDPEVAYRQSGKWNEYFNNKNDIILEIGTGLGNYFSQQVSEHKDKNYIGMEIKFKRCFITTEKSIAKGGEHFIVIKDFGQKISDIFSDGEISLTNIFFPDPWANKDRQKKHRIIQKDFLQNLYNKTKKGGKVCFKTDHTGYFDDSLELLDEMNIWKQENKTYHYERDHDGFNINEMTEFEHIFRKDKLEICYIELVK